MDAQRAIEEKIRAAVQARLEAKGLKASPELKKNLASSSTAPAPPRKASTKKTDLAASSKDDKDRRSSTSDNRRASTSSRASRGSVKKQPSGTADQQSATTPYPRKSSDVKAQGKRKIVKPPTAGEGKPSLLHRKSSEGSSSNPKEAPPSITPAEGGKSPAEAEPEVSPDARKASTQVTSSPQPPPPATFGNVDETSPAEKEPLGEEDAVTRKAATLPLQGDAAFPEEQGEDAQEAEGGWTKGPQTDEERDLTGINVHPIDAEPLSKEAMLRAAIAESAEGEAEAEGEGEWTKGPQTDEEKELSALTVTPIDSALLSIEATLAAAVSKPLEQSPIPADTPVKQPAPARPSQKVRSNMKRPEGPKAAAPAPPEAAPEKPSSIARAGKVGRNASHDLIEAAGLRSSRGKFIEGEEKARMEALARQGLSAAQIKERMARERAERERQAKEQQEREKAEKEETERAEKEETKRAEKERIEKEAQEKAEKEKEARERAERQKAEEEEERRKAEEERKKREAKEKAEQERIAREKAEKERAERLERIKAEKERRELEAKEKAEKERLEREQREEETRQRKAALEAKRKEILEEAKRKQAAKREAAEAARKKAEEERAAQEKAQAQAQEAEEEAQHRGSRRVLISEQANTTKLVERLSLSGVSSSSARPKTASGKKSGSFAVSSSTNPTGWKPWGRRSRDLSASPTPPTAPAQRQGPRGSSPPYFRSAKTPPRASAAAAAAPAKTANDRSDKQEAEMPPTEPKRSPSVYSRSESRKSTAVFEVNQSPPKTPSEAFLRGLPFQGIVLESANLPIEAPDQFSRSQSVMSRRSHGAEDEVEEAEPVRKSGAPPPRQFFKQQTREKVDELQNRGGSAKRNTVFVGDRPRDMSTLGGLNPSPSAPPQRKTLPATPSLSPPAPKPTKLPQAAQKVTRETNKAAPKASTTPPRKTSATPAASAGAAARSVTPPAAAASASSKPRTSASEIRRPGPIEPSLLPAWTNETPFIQLHDSRRYRTPPKHLDAVPLGDRHFRDQLKDLTLRLTNRRVSLLKSGLLPEQACEHEEKYRLLLHEATRAVQNRVIGHPSFPSPEVEVNLKVFAPPARKDFAQAGEDDENIALFSLTGTLTPPKTSPSASPAKSGRVSPMTLHLVSRLPDRVKGPAHQPNWADLNPRSVAATDVASAISRCATPFSRDTPSKVHERRTRTPPPKSPPKQSTPPSSSALHSHPHGLSRGLEGKMRDQLLSSSVLEPIRNPPSPPPAPIKNPSPPKQTPTGAASTSGKRQTPQGPPTMRDPMGMTSVPPPPLSRNDDMPDSAGLIYSVYKEQRKAALERIRTKRKKDRARAAAEAESAAAAGGTSGAFVSEAPVGGASKKKTKKGGKRALVRSTTSEAGDASEREQGSLKKEMKVIKKRIENHRTRFFKVRLACVDTSWTVHRERNAGASTVKSLPLPRDCIALVEYDRKVVDLDQFVESIKTKITLHEKKEARRSKSHHKVSLRLPEDEKAAISTAAAASAGFATGTSGTRQTFSHYPPSNETSPSKSSLQVSAPLEQSRQIPVGAPVTSVISGTQPLTTSASVSFHPQTVVSQYPANQRQPLGIHDAYGWRSAGQSSHSSLSLQPGITPVTTALTRHTQGGQQVATSGSIRLVGGLGTSDGGRVVLMGPAPPASVTVQPQAVTRVIQGAPPPPPAFGGGLGHSVSSQALGAAWGAPRPWGS
uniref:Uncharacterized protein n=1 Tax=Chromera velia CCMP2878 TaxID=1169474 RepID=A0A0G4GN24_9ALVE|eukprot:Cvel_22623.t1-p1 / transcript=Cvel_22623.t1 / gene=Cvel_22623 / organism=Chromera_velia_CCMP2878 / gene_product=hypothetical protein / transcript_product=hypothetical protein / location=Cvel_scaffold2241:15216-23596(+) / protein_length=1707 / sequence_SO=supercontig / SO=protein_coding / is_pseudo=false